LLHERRLQTPKTHDIKHLVDLLIPTDRRLRSLRRGADTLTRFAVEFRYPGLSVTARRSRWALQKTVVFRKEVRGRPGLRP
jgi:hypothetical protein